VGLTCENVFHHSPVDCAAGHVLAPVLHQALVGDPQVVPGDLGAHVVGDMHTDVVAQELHPPGIFAIHSACKCTKTAIPPPPGEYEMVNMLEWVAGCG